MVGNVDYRAGAWVAGFFDTPEKFFYFHFHCSGIEITNQYYSLQIRAVPIFIKTTNGFILATVNNRHQAYWKPVRIFRPVKQHPKKFFLHALHGSLTHAPFFVNNSTLCFNFFTFETYLMCPIVQHEKTFIKYVCTVGGNFNAIHG